MITEKLKGTGVALVTPFRKEGSIDFNALTKLVEHVIEGGVEYLVLIGTTSESPVLSLDERNAIISHVKDVNNGRLPIVVGCGGNNTANVMSLFEQTDLEGVDAILSVAPYYNKPNQKGLYNHYRAIANASPLPVIIYNVPGRTGCNITAETTLKLAHEFDNIVAVKEASGNFDQIMQIVKNKPENFIVLSGDDAITLPLISIGVEGVISVSGQVFPKEFSEMVRLGLKGKYTEARKYHYMLTDVTNALFEEGNPVGAKAALEILGITDKYVRMPLASASKGLSVKIKKLIEEEVLAAVN